MKINGKDELAELFRAQGEKRWAVAATSAAERISKLKLLRKAIVSRQEELYAALWKDFHKSAMEGWLTETYTSIAEINHTIKHLKSWMRDRRVAGDINLPLSTSYLRCEPKGRVLIMSPWNYPFQLLIAPLVSAIAAGNVVIAKPSNKTPATSAFIASLIEELFSREEIAVVEGPGKEIGDLLLALPFDHIFFTGSPKIGARVGEAAARVHAALTLELGGKSPTIILPDADIEDAAGKIMWGKCLNAGQTCIAPDYLFCPRGLEEGFAAAAKRVVQRFYGADEESWKNAVDFPRIVDAAACEKHQTLVADAVAKGAKKAFGGVFDPAQRYDSPTILTGVTTDMAIMAEEIFGPILPVIGYDSIEEVIAFITSRPKPLALYVFGKDKNAIDQVLSRTTSGSACVNNLIMQIENLNVPFGGIGMSGTGNYHGHFGFRTFSHERNILRQGPLNVVKYLFPPYGGPFQKLLRGLLEAISHSTRKS
ncbi:MAG: aldehyde dehydrogenase family protein [Treponemataceae bacterium]